MKRLGAALLLLGVGIFAIFWSAGIWAFLTSPEVPVIVKLAAGSFFTGALLLGVASVKENWGERDKYREVKQ